jgi:hypothetical protein
MGHITLADLQDAHRVEQYYQAFCAQGIVQPCEANRLHVHTAAVHALTGKRPGALFLANVRAHRWTLPTVPEEEEARRRIQRLTAFPSARFTPTQEAALDLPGIDAAQQPASEMSPCPHKHVEPYQEYKQEQWYYLCLDCQCVLPPRPHTLADHFAAPEVSPTSQAPLWCRVLEWLQARVDATKYTLWLAPLRPLILTDGLLQIAVPQPFIQAWLMEHYQLLVSDAMQAVTGDRYQVVFIVQKEGKP